MKRIARTLILVVVMLCNSCARTEHNPTIPKQPHASAAVVNPSQPVTLEMFSAPGDTLPASSHMVGALPDRIVTVIARNLHEDASGDPPAGFVVYVHFDNCQPAPGQPFPPNDCSSPGEWCSPQHANGPYGEPSLPPYVSQYQGFLQCSWMTPDARNVEYTAEVKLAPGKSVADYVPDGVSAIFKFRVFHVPHTLDPMVVTLYGAPIVSGYRSFHPSAYGDVRELSWSYPSGVSASFPGRDTLKSGINR